jgi:hypothetical protein
VRGDRVNKLLDDIHHHIDCGGTVRIATATRYTDVTKKTVKRFRDTGYELFVVRGDSLCMRSGKRLDCIATDTVNLCRITVF